jgi:hypothetical protein
METDRILAGYVINIFLSSPTLQQLQVFWWGDVTVLAQNTSIEAYQDSPHICKNGRCHCGRSNCIRLPNSGKIIGKVKT